MQEFLKYKSDGICWLNNCSFVSPLKLEKYYVTVQTEGSLT